LQTKIPSDKGCILVGVALTRQLENGEQSGCRVPSVRSTISYQRSTSEIRA
jgi:hypothetical protein